MAISPSSVVYLLDTPLDKTQKNQLRFTSAAAQHAYFNSRVKHAFTDEHFTYVRKDSTLKIEGHVDLYYDCNYVMYQNTGFGSKWFYAFIERMEFVNPNCTLIYIKTDVYQTWLFDTTIKQSFVVREHVDIDEDVIGGNLLDEGLETGDYISRVTFIPSFLDRTNAAIVIGCTINPQSTGDGYGVNFENIDGCIFSSTYSGVAYFAFNQSDISYVNDFLKTLADAGKSDAVTSIFMYPGAFLPEFDATNRLINNAYTTFEMFTVSTDKYLSIGDYIPKNNKLYSFPYILLHATNHMGNSADYKYEYFMLDEYTNDTETFEMITYLAPNPTIFLYPRGYKGQTINKEEVLTIQPFPLCNWTYDAFKNWLAQSGLGVAIGTVAASVAIGAGIATANPVAIGGGALGVANEMTQLYQHSIQPPQAQGNTNVNNGGHYACDLGTFEFKHMTIREEYARKIDNYFEMFGYKVNALKTPNTSGRPNWNYVQTIDINITGGIPVQDMEELKAIYNSGVTLWHNPATFCDYSANNH